MMHCKGKIVTNLSKEGTEINRSECSGIEGYDLLKEFALDIRWTWSHVADELWARLDSEMWNLTRNSWAILRTISIDKLQKELADPDIQKLIEHLQTIKHQELQTTAWFEKKFPNSHLKNIAYFSMEYMLSEALPIYSGGLGNVAGDQLKAANDLGVPVSAIGLLYQQGYFRQIIDKEGNQQALYPYNDPGQLPITPLRHDNGEWLRIEIPFPGYSIWLRTWQVKVGRVKLYLLDSNDPANYPAHRGITSELYGGNSEMRLQQELILGIGGWRLLKAIGIKPEVCHLNEGHAAFAILERAVDFMNETGQPFEEALAITRAGNLFTTHTAVSAGFDRFTPFLIYQYLKRYAENKLKISIQEFLAIGRLNPNDENEPFNMAYLAIRGSGAVNGVSKLHGKVSRKIFESVFPRWPSEEIPIGYVTNGVHMPSWDSKASEGFWTEICGKSRWNEEPEILEEKIREVSNEKLWEMRNISRKELIDFSRERLIRQRLVTGESVENVEMCKNLFDPNTLTLGFARRFATYKRPNMLLQDPERLISILTNFERPVQLIIAGKAHPADLPGQALIKQWNTFIKRPEVRSNIIFLSDYDILLTQKLVQGVDVWINTPRRPWEACGTSGMKVLVNGGVNLSELDGWWAEAYSPEVGWCLGDGQDHGNDPKNDAFEANALYGLLENEVIPQFYQRDAEGIPIVWLKRMRESMARLTPRYSAHRAVRQYTTQYYAKASENYLHRSSNKGAFGSKFLKWEDALKKNWSTLRFGEIKIETKEGQHIFDIQVYLHDLNPKEVNVELYAESLNSSQENKTPFLQSMLFQRELKGTPNMYLYKGCASATRPIGDFTIRIIPTLEGVSTPVEMPLILWQH
jgi:glycogen phosphorylase